MESGTIVDLRVEGIYKSFEKNGEINQVLKDIHLEVKQGEFVTLLGPSGCGKTTLLTTIAGFKKPDKGRILLGGKEIKGAGPDRGFMFQNYALFPWMNIRKNIEFPLKQAKMEAKERKKRVEELISLAGLTGHENQLPHEISGGMKQRTALVRALANKPEVLLMDEPLGALDLKMRQNLQMEIQDIWEKEKITFLMVTHDVDEAVYLSDRVILMTTDSGRIEKDLKIDLKRPRNRDDERYRAIVKELTDDINGSY